MNDAVEREDVARCRCAHEAGDTDCAVHPICNSCGGDLGGAEVKADRDRLLAKLLASHARAEKLEKEFERMREILDVCHRGVDALWNAYHSGAWEMNHHDDDDDRPCPEDDTCECEGREAATLLSKASGMLTSWSRIEAAKEPA